MLCGTGYPWYTIVTYMVIIIFTAITIIQNLQQQYSQQPVDEEEWRKTCNQVFFDNESERVLQFIHQLNHQYSHTHFVIFIVADNFPQKFQSTLWHTLKMYDVEIQDVFADTATINSHQSTNLYKIYCVNEKDVSTWSWVANDNTVYVCFPICAI